MIPLVFGHLGLMIYAVRDGLSAQEILSRTQGNWFWGLFYGFFVLAASVHASIGLRTLIGESVKIRHGALNGITMVFVLGLVMLGARAVVAVTLP